MGNDRNSFPSDKASQWVVMDSLDQDSSTPSDVPNEEEEPEVNSCNIKLVTQTMAEQKAHDSDLNGDLFNLVVEDSLEREDRRVRSFDLNQLPEEEEVQSKMTAVDSFTETISVRKDGCHIDLNKVPDDEFSEDSNAEKERKRFIRSMLKHYFPDFY